MLFLDTKGKMNIISSESFIEKKFFIEDDKFDLKLNEFEDYMKSLISNIADDCDENDNILLSIFFDEPTKEEELTLLFNMVVNSIINAIVDEKLEQEYWQPRNSLVDMLNVMLHYQIKLINHKTKINNFNIKIFYKNKQIYEMIEQEN
jgi:hypothetical protein